MNPLTAEEYVALLEASELRPTNADVSTVDLRDLPSIY